MNDQSHHDDRNHDHLEQRLRNLGTRPVGSLPASKVQAIQDRLLQGPASRRPLWLPYVAAAAAILGVGGLVHGMQGDGDRASLRPAEQVDTETTVSHTTTTHGDGSSHTTTTVRHDEPVTTLRAEPVPTGPGASSTTASTTPTGTEPPRTEPPRTTAPRNTEPPRTSVPPATEPPFTTAPRSTEPPHTTLPPSTEPPHTTLPPSTIPSPSFTLAVERSGTKLIWQWPAAGGGGAHHYVLLWVTTAGVTEWPMGGHVIYTSGGLGTTTVQETYEIAETRRWVLAVVNGDNRLVALSNIAVSN